MNVGAVHQELFRFLIATKTRMVLSYVLRVLGTIKSLDPLSFHVSDTWRLPGQMELHDRPSREQSYLEIVVQKFLETLALNALTGLSC
jgi:hypothetical protein